MRALAAWLQCELALSVEPIADFLVRLFEGGAIISEEREVVHVAQVAANLQGPFHEVVEAVDVQAARPVAQIATERSSSKSRRR